ncbi:protein kinase domain-containing protein [Anabaena sp. CCY 9402-a]|uniref:protein kinase domain-containing protein n=1 Tax=Anabaena sp. CCY 9402-a TaxID=3103867 RepID=UPI0039C7404F
MQTPTLLNHRYRVIRVLGAGGFGETFLAEDTQMPSGRRCVIKKLKPVENNPQIYQLVQERFQREAAILEELGDGFNQIPKLYAYFVEDDDFFLVQEYIEGETLQEKLLQQGLLSESSVREILSNILPVLDYVHSKRIVHRDIKPENILIRHADGKPVLIDFGAVKETMGTIMTVSGESSRSIVIGTPGFMPSEQSAGRPVFASDLYSLGLTAIYLLTGKIPQQLEADPGTGELIWRHHALSISPSFAAFLDKAIASHSRDRYSTAKEMLQALQHGVTPIAPTIPVSPPTLVSAPPAYVQQQQTVVSAPPAGVPSQPPVYSQPPAPVSKGMGDWQKAVIIGGVIGACVIGGLWITRPSETQTSSTPVETNASSTSVSTPQQQQQQQQQQQIQSPNPPVEEPINQRPPVEEPQFSSPNSSITQQEAVALIQNWQEAKRVLFAPPYDRQRGAELTTGEAYRKNIGSGSSQEWLENNNSYYRYGVQRIDSVRRFVANDNQATIEVVITEDRKLYRNGKLITDKNTAFETVLVRYSLQKENGQLKIADYATVP